jgi:hypothetical protein
MKNISAVPLIGKCAEVEWFPSKKKSHLVLDLQLQLKPPEAFRSEMDGLLDLLAKRPNTWSIETDNVQR